MPNPQFRNRRKPGIEFLKFVRSNVPTWPPSLSLSGAEVHPSAIGCSALGGIRELREEAGSDSPCSNGPARLPLQSPGVSTIFWGYEVRLKALPATIWSEDWFTSADFSLAQWTCSTFMRNAAPRDGCDLESNGCLETEQRFAPPEVIKCGRSFVACILKFIPCVLHPARPRFQSRRRSSDQIRKV